MARPWSRPRPAPRPPERLGRAGDGRQVPRAARPDRGRAVARSQPPAGGIPPGEGARPRPQPGRGRRVRASVVGGGLAGLAAAVELADSGAEVTLYEAR